MKNECIDYLVERIVENLKGTCYFEDIDVLIKEFLEKNISEAKKEKVIELLYLYQLYRNGYVTPDPRFLGNMKIQVIQILKVQNDNELDNKIKQVENVVDMLKQAENNPLQTAKKMKEDMKKYKGCIF